jgi:hypothetical protein
MCQKIINQIRCTYIVRRAAIFKPNSRYSNGIGSDRHKTNLAVTTDNTRSTLTLQIKVLPLAVNSYG